MATATHCKHGHIWTAENRRRNKQGRTYCQTCVREGQRRRREEALRVPIEERIATRTHCLKGHALTPDNTRWDAGSLTARCRRCARRAQQVARGRALTPYEAPLTMANALVAHCRKGHPYNESNTKWVGGGKHRKCRICLRYTWIRKVYGLSSDLWDALVVSHEGRCAICSKATADLVVDHEHGDGRVRGLLCGPCNLAIGLFCDSPEALRSAVAYLETR